MALDMLGIGLVPLPCEPDASEGSYIPKVQDAEALIGRKTRAIILVTPNNRKQRPGADQ
jgi:aspartate/methionine/tyrosine aminotransferase